MSYQLWRKPVTHPYATEAWEGIGTYRWGWLARFAAWERTKAGWTEYKALPLGQSPLQRSS